MSCVLGSGILSQLVLRIQSKGMGMLMSGLVVAVFDILPDCPDSEIARQCTHSNHRTRRSIDDDQQRSTIDIDPFVTTRNPDTLASTECACSLVVHEPGARMGCSSLRLFPTWFEHGKMSGVHSFTKAERGVYPGSRYSGRALSCSGVHPNPVVTGIHAPNGMGYLAYLNLRECIKGTYSIE